MPEFVSVARVGDIPAGEGRAFRVGQKLVAVFYVDGQYTAIDDICPHMGASLATGYVEDGGVTCPWHAWRFSIKDGTWLDNPQSKLCQKTYQVQVIGDEVCVAAE
jgi:nitrite reductase (NADH) small subunit